MPAGAAVRYDGGVREPGFANPLVNPNQAGGQVNLQQEGKGGKGELGRHCVVDDPASPSADGGTQVGDWEVDLDKQSLPGQ